MTNRPLYYETPDIQPVAHEPSDEEEPDEEEPDEEEPDEEEPDEEEPDEKEPDEEESRQLYHALSHMTIWRFLTWLGGQVGALQEGLRLLSQHDPHHPCHRYVGAVDPRKYRHADRQKTLSQARRLLHLIDQWEQRFPERFFPRFATRTGFT